MNIKMNKVIIFSVLAMISNFAHAVGIPNPTAIPVPGVLALVGIGALAAVAVKFFKK